MSQSGRIHPVAAGARLSPLCPGTSYSQGSFSFTFMTLVHHLGLGEVGVLLVYKPTDSQSKEGLT